MLFINALGRLVAHQSNLRSLLVNELQSEKMTKTSTVGTASSKGSALAEGQCKEEAGAFDAEEGKPDADSNDTTVVGAARTETASTSLSDNVILTLKEEMASISAENDRLQRLCTSMHANHRQQSLRVSTFFLDLVYTCLMAFAFPKFKFKFKDALLLLFYAILPFAYFIALLNEMKF